MAAPRAVDVCKRFWISPLTYFSIIAIVIGALGAIVTITIGYEMAYRSDVGFGLCYQDLPGIRRACILDLGGGVVSMVLGILFLIIEFTTVFINTKDWKITFFVVKIVLAVIATIVLGAGTIQGAASYTEYCNDDDVSILDHILSDSNSYYNSYYGPYVGQDYKRCDFYSDERQHDPDVDFLTIVIVIAVATLFWIVLLGSEIFRLCILLMGKKPLQICILGTAIDNNNNNNNNNSNNNNTRGTEAELQQLPTASPQYSEV